MMEYTHRPPGETVVMGFGDYRVVREERFELDGCGYLFVIADAPVGSACVGAGTLRFIHVRGRILSWRELRDPSGFPVSTLEPLTIDEEIDRIRNFLVKLYPTLQVCF